MWEWGSIIPHLASTLAFPFLCGIKNDLTLNPFQFERKEVEVEVSAKV